MKKMKGQGKIMASNYEKITEENLAAFFSSISSRHVEESLGATLEGDALLFRAFGAACTLSPRGIELGGEKLTDPRALLISLYAAHAAPEPLELEPLRAFKDLPGSRSYGRIVAVGHRTVWVTDEAGRLQALSAKTGTPRFEPGIGVNEDRHVTLDPVSDDLAFRSDSRTLRVSATDGTVRDVGGRE